MISDLEEFRILKKLSYIQESDFEYEIDEDGNGFAIIENFKVDFQIDKYGEINLWTAKLTKI